jgi:hypothetical protein
MTQDPDSQRGPRWYRRLSYAIALVLLFPAWAGVRLIQSGAVAIGIGAIFVAFITFALAIRYLHNEPGLRRDGSYEITSQHVDYVVWTALGVPFILIGLLVVWLIADGLNRT